MDDLEQMHNDLQSFQDEETEMLKDWEDAMKYLDSKGVPPGASLLARIIMYKGATTPELIQTHKHHVHIEMNIDGIKSNDAYRLMENVDDLVRKRPDVNSYSWRVEEITT